jgi:translation initiation factor IF-2
VASSDDKKETEKPKKKRRRIARPVEGKSQQSNASRTSKGRPTKKGKGGKREQRPELSEEDIQKEIKETLARLSGGGKSKSSKLRREKRQQIAQQKEEELAQQEADQKVLKVTEFVTVQELANMMDAQVTEIISACMSLGMMVSINQRLDAETLSIVAEEFGYTVEFVDSDIEETEEAEVEEDPSKLIPRPPIVTVMGHVDHGKTSLLDYVRKENVIAGEAGGITQHIGAYNVELGDNKTITFLDTPGHEAFTAMRARGAQVTDLVIIVIAADDSVMPQTREAINHAQAAGVPMVFAFNKIDKPGANADKIREELSGMDILVEDWGGKYQAQEISAKNGQGIEDLLEKVLLEAELLELTANPEKLAVGTVIEASLDKGRGYVTNLLVESGTLRIGDMLVAGAHAGKVKAMFNERGQDIVEAGPATPVSILGFNGAPAAGDKFKTYEDEREAKQIANKREQLLREQGVRSQRHITLDEIGRRLALGDFQELNLIVKGDVDGSVEALSDSMLKLSTENIQVNVIHKSVGQISESDVLLASASDAIIVGFQVRPSSSARKIAEKEEIQIKLYSVIYDAIEEVKDAMQGMLKPKFEERIVCNIEVRETFKISKVGTIAGCYVLDGKINRKTDVRLIRDGVVKYSGRLGSLKRFKDDVKEVAAGYECGLNIEGYNDIKVGDIIEGYEQVEVEQKL